MFNNIVVAVDGSDHADKALALAADLAAKYDARLSIYHVLLVGHLPQEIRSLSDLPGAEQPPLVVGAGSIPAELPREVRVDIAEKLLQKGREIAKQHGVQEAEAIWEEGSAHKCILEYARARGADTIVIGSRGLNDFEGVLLGSVSHKVSHLFDGTVITVR